MAWFGAVQAQEYHLAKWALGLRLPPTTDAALDAAFNEGAILRTHAMRPTWHFVTPEDIRWIQALTSPRVHAASAYMLRQVEVDEALYGHSSDVIAGALAGGKQLTRAELGAALAQAGIEASGNRLAYIVMWAELEALICSGPRRGKQFTYMLLDERAPQARRLDPDEALAELTRRYFRSHGPATMQDFAWWSGLTLAQVKAGLNLLGTQAVAEEIDGVTYWSTPDSGPMPDKPSPQVLLLPPYDEYGVGYTDRSGLLDPAHSDLASGTIFGGTLVIDGHVLGTWKRRIEKGNVVIDLTPFRPLSAAEQAGVEAAAQRFAAFVELPLVLA